MFTLVTDHPIALESIDRIDFLHSGSYWDNSKSPPFNKKLFELMPGPISVLDLGCAGGGFVKSIVDDGHEAVGLEGCEKCKEHQKFEWATIPNNLFLCDVTKPFTIYQSAASDCMCDTSSRLCPDAQELAKFDIVTAWEIMEHIHERDLPQLITNVLTHLRPAGLWIMSVSEQVDHHFHVTTHNIDWWLNVFAKYGLINQPDLVTYFGQTFVRGPWRTEWALEAGQSFHLVLKRSEKHEQA